MKLYGIPRINALGLKGPEEFPKKMSKKFNIETLEINNDNIEKSEEEVYKKSKKIFNEKEKAAFIGGDHSITYPLFKGFSKNKNNPFLVVFDAHADCMPPLKEPTHEEFLRGIVERGLNPKKVILIGARKIEPAEQKFLDEAEIKVFNNVKNLTEIKEYIKEKTRGHDIYLSIDIDVIDPQFAPAVNYPEPKGILPEELEELIDSINKEGYLKAIDIVEMVPKKDINKKTEEIIKKLIDKLRTF